MVYTLSDHFALWLDYAVPGSFTGIDINATNEYSTAMHSQMVKFEGS